ncbi:MAG TPA: CsiV family protein [Steroidobacteraceae bacterium]|jgi:peptidoglycan-binding protein CsiV|nr:CsiV family protein [Steroidobacteraceae bacterium]
MKPSRNLLSLALLGLALLGCVTLTASAQQSTQVLQSYDVELLIFRTLNPNASPEQWSMEAAAAGQRLAIPEDEPEPFSTSAPAPTTTTNFPALAPARFKLTGIYDTLRRSRNYQPLAHFGWTQPGYARNDAKLLTINSLVPAGSGIVGQVALTRGRYLHLTVDLVYDAPGAAGEPTQRFVLRQSRRMRSNERHYLDSPRFGVIAIVTPSTPSG